LNVAGVNIVNLLLLLCVLYDRIGPAIAMVLIGLGTGGIKPCVSAFGGDQFTSQQVRLH